MEDSTATPQKLKIQTFSKWGFLGLFFIFLVFFVAFFLVGSLGPPVVKKITAVPEHINRQDLTQNNSISFSNLNKTNQQLVLELDINYKDSKKASCGFDAEFILSIKARENKDWIEIQSPKKTQRSVLCKRGRNYCDTIWLAHIPFISYSEYNFTIQLVNFAEYPMIGDIGVYAHVVNDRFTLFEMWIRLWFCFATWIMIAIWFYNLRKYKWHTFSLEQKWVTFLLFGLVLYNNPFFPLQISSKGLFFELMDVLFLVSFLVLLLFFWLVMFDGLWKDPKERLFLNFYFPKILLVGSFWVTAMVLFFWTEFHQLSNAGVRVYEIQGYIFFKLLSVAILGLYIFWLAYSICRSAFFRSRAMPEFEARVKFFGMFSIIIIGVTIGGIVFEFVGPSMHNAIEFISFLALFNLYVYTLLFAYLPAKISNQVEQVEIGMIKLEEDLDTGTTDDLKLGDSTIDLEEINLHDDENDNLHL